MGISILTSSTNEVDPLDCIESKSRWAVGGQVAMTTFLQSKINSSLITSVVAVLLDTRESGACFVARMDTEPSLLTIKASTLRHPQINNNIFYISRNKRALCTNLVLKRLTPAGRSARSWSGMACIPSAGRVAAPSVNIFRESIQYHLLFEEDKINKAVILTTAIASQ